MDSNIISLINEGRGSNIPPKSKNFGHSPLSIVQWIIPFHSSIQHGIKTYFSFLMLTLLLIFSTHVNIAFNFLNCTVCTNVQSRDYYALFFIRNYHALYQSPKKKTARYWCCVVQKCA